MNISAFKMGAKEYVFFLVSGKHATLDHLKLHADIKDL